MLEDGGHNSAEMLVPIGIHGHTVLLSVESAGAQSMGDESEIAARKPSLDEVLNGLAALAMEIGTRLQQTGATRASVEFGCEIAVESGTFVAVIGKGSAKSTFKVGLEWTSPTN